MALTVGTAGHIDHGKTWLVRALTGKDTDRLPEERERGISIDLGYAPLDLPDGRRLSLIDVPGHERFVRNMVAGATGIDLFLLVIDAAEGARPQTHEHLAILAAARDRARRRRGHEGGRRRRGDARARARGGARARAGRRGGARQREDRPGPRRAPRRARARRRPCVSEHTSVDGAGAAARRPRLLAARDRHGRDGDALVRARSARATCSAPSRAGGRCACAASRCTTGRSSGPRRASGSRSRCPGWSGRELRRGDVLIAPGPLRPSYRLDVALEELEPIRDGARLHVHHGTSAVAARVTQARRATPSSGSQRPSSPPAATGSCSGARRRSAAASCSTPRRRATPTPTGSSARPRGEETIHAPVLVDAASGAGRTSGSAGSATSSSGESTPPTRSIPASTRPRSPGRPPCSRDLPFERRGSKLYRPGASAEPRRAARPRRLRVEAELEAAAPGAARVADAELARFLEQTGRLVRLGDGYAVSAAAYERARGARRRGVRDGRPDRARPLPRPRRLRPPRRAAPARAPRRGRRHSPRRRRARAQAFGVTLCLSSQRRRSSAAAGIYATTIRGAPDVLVHPRRDGRAN